MVRRTLLATALLGALTLAANPAAWADSHHSLAVEKDADLAAATSINPRYLLMDPNGREVSHEDFRGKFQLLSFGYTYCPDVCPTTLVDMAAILKQLDEDGGKAKYLQAIFISVDPERDTPEVLRTYTRFFDPRILGLTAKPPLVKRAADNFRVRYAKVREPGDPPERYAVDHSAGLYLIAPDGTFLKKFAYGTPAADVARWIAEAMAP